jgi:hypothetical protein
MNEERNFDDLEQFLQSEANDHKMFPSDRVWNNISEQIQPKRSWPALTIIATVIVLSLGVGTFLNYPPENPLSKIHFGSTDNIEKTSKESFTKNENSLSLKQHIVEAIKNRKIQASSDIIVPTNDNSLVSFEELYADISSPTAQKTPTQENNSIYEPTITNRAFEPGEIYISNHFPKIGDETFTSKKLNTPNPLFHKDKVGLKGKLDYEIYGTPSISYRSLSEDQVVAQSASNSKSLNSLVNQKAGLGSEFGLGIRYKTSNSFTLKLGLQFNIRQYYIEAYKAPGLATIELLQGNTFDSLSFISKFGNGNGLQQTKLNNRLYQISLPIGLEWSALSSKNWGLGISASIQPTLSLNHNVYILSTDYKYYANGESLFRKWNINSALSANLSYKLKNSTFYIGPQVRYQHLPTYVDKYPIKEYRIDYGLRIGIIKSIK